MNKTILVLTGEPEQKNDFIERVKSLAWINNTNPKSNLGRFVNQVRRNKDRDEDYWNSLSELMKLLNKRFNYEEEFIVEEIEKFLSDDDEVKIDRDGRKYDKFILIIHGLSRDLRDRLKSDYPLFVIRLATSNQPSSETAQDFVLETDLEDYDKEVIRVVDILTHK